MISWTGAEHSLQELSYSYSYAQYRTKWIKIKKDPTPTGAELVSTRKTHISLSIHENALN